MEAAALSVGLSEAAAVAEEVVAVVLCAVVPRSCLRLLSILQGTARIAFEISTSVLLVEDVARSLSSTRSS